MATSPQDAQDAEQTDGAYGIRVTTKQSATQASVNVNGDIYSENTTVEIRHRGTGLASVAIEQSAIITSAEGSGIEVLNESDDNNNLVAGSTNPNLGGGVLVVNRGSIGTQDSFVEHNGTTAVNSGLSNLTIRHYGMIFADDYGIRISNAGDRIRDGIGNNITDILIVGDINVHDENSAMHIDHNSNGDLIVTAMQGAAITGGERTRGICAISNSTVDAIVTSGSNINLGAGSTGIRARNPRIAGQSIIVTGDINAHTGISIVEQGDNNDMRANFDISRRITTTNTGNAISFLRGEHLDLILCPGFEFVKQNGEHANIVMATS